MKTKLIMTLSVFCLFLMSVQRLQTITATTPQESKVIAVYDGNEGYGYNFIAQHKDDASEYTMTFQKVNENVMKEFDLDGEVYLNQQFEITYTVKKVVTKDENGFDEEDEVLTITGLKAL